VQNIGISLFVVESVAVEAVYRLALPWLGR